MFKKRRKRGKVNGEGKVDEKNSIVLSSCDTNIGFSDIPVDVFAQGLKKAQRVDVSVSKKPKLSKEALFANLNPIAGDFVFEDGQNDEILFYPVDDLVKSTTKEQRVSFISDIDLGFFDTIKEGSEAVEKAMSEDREVRKATILKNTLKTTKRNFSDHLPIDAFRDHIIDLVKRNQVTIITAQTGSGKSTRLPVFLAASFCDSVVCTQPRRVACISLARHVRNTMESSGMPYEVRHAVRFDDQTTPRTNISYMTDGLLLKHMEADIDLSQYDAVIIDEAHERSVNTDLLVSLLGQLIGRNSELRVIITSATADVELYKGYFPEAPVVDVPGRLYTIEERFSEVIFPDYVVAAAQQAIELHKEEKTGHILCFLPGQAEIETAVSLCEDHIEREVKTNPQFVTPFVLPLYGGLRPEEQQKVLINTQRRKIIFTTNLAETSLTIPEVTTVIDSGTMRVSSYSSSLGVQSLLTVPASRAICTQRAGRAGRTRAGVCIHMFPKRVFQLELLSQVPPEILRCDICDVVLRLLSLSVDPLKFNYVTSPIRANLQRAIAELTLVGALHNGLLTPLGEEISRFPLNPLDARLLVVGKHLGVGEEMAIIIALSTTGRFTLSEKAISRFYTESSDHLTLIKCFESYEVIGSERERKQWASHIDLPFGALETAKSIKDQLVRLMRLSRQPFVTELHREMLVKQALAVGMFTKAARIKSTNVYIAYRSMLECEIARNSVVNGSSPKYIVYNKLLVTAKRKTLHIITEVHPHWLDSATDMYRLLKI
ncbi:hypothetical protein PCE1_000720 [Barthelona sp. PCE]